MPLELSLFVGMMFPERHAGLRIYDRSGASEESVGWIQELAEVAGAHLRGGHSRRLGHYRLVVDPFLRSEEEQLVLQSSKRNGPANRIGVLLVVEGGGAAVLERVRAAVARPGVRLEVVVLHVVRTAAAEAVAAALGHHADLTAADAAVLGHVAARQDLHFLDGVDVLDPDDRSIGSSADRGCPVHGDVVLVGRALPFMLKPL